MKTIIIILAALGLIFIALIVVTVIALCIAASKTDKQIEQMCSGFNKGK